jgi:hypothetical protein
MCTHYELIHHELILSLAEDNPGAHRVLGTLARESGESGSKLRPAKYYFDILTRERITGSKLWTLYKDECGEDMHRLRRRLLQYRSKVPGRARNKTRSVQSTLEKLVAPLDASPAAEEMTPRTLAQPPSSTHVAAVALVAAVAAAVAVGGMFLYKRMK